jgi:hypothetical protein
MTSNDKDQHYSVNGKITEYTQSGDCRFLAYIHIMMEKSPLAGEVGGCTPTTGQHITITYKVAVYTPAERADTFPLFHLYPICTLWAR